MNCFSFILFIFSFSLLAQQNPELGFLQSLKKKGAHAAGFVKNKFSLEEAQKIEILLPSIQNKEYKLSDIKAMGLDVVVKNGSCFFRYVDQEDYDRSAFRSIDKLSNKHVKATQNFGNIYLPHEAEGSDVENYFGIPQKSWTQKLLKFGKEQLVNDQINETVNMGKGVANKFIPKKFEIGRPDYLIPRGDKHLSGFISGAGKPKKQIRPEAPFNGEEVYTIPFHYVEGLLDEKTGEFREDDPFFELKKGQGKMAFFLKGSQLNIAMSKEEPKKMMEKFTSVFKRKTSEEWELLKP